MINRTCPACGVVSETRTVSRADLVTMQNYIYRDHARALNAPVGAFELYFCQNCGLAFNAAFDQGLMTYDEGYTAYISSPVFDDYYQETAAFLNKKFDLTAGPVVDIACGKGDFLTLLCDMYPGVRGLGIDPSYDGAEWENAAFVRDVFREEQIEEKPALIICRHAFDQIGNPPGFLNSIRRALAKYGETNFFIEVGDLQWMLENRSFADLCYERRSFFTTDSLENILRLGGFSVEKVDRAFGEQYIRAYGTVRPGDPAVPASDLNFKDTGSIAGSLIDYAAAEAGLISEMKTRLEALKNEGYVIAVWGIATKGVVFCNLIDRDGALIDHCIDISPQKLNCFVPHTGHRISAPEAIQRADSSPAAIVVMNPNYLAEISAVCEKLGLKASFLDVNGQNMSTV